MTRAQTSYSKNVFINCPFDQRYAPLFNAMVFVVHDVGFRPRCALEASDAGQPRLKKIMDIISQCKYSIHDLSRIELDRRTGLPRFNMPLELGLDLGCRVYGPPKHKTKYCLILDTKPYRYQKFISDISGQDVYAHGGKERKAIYIIRDWLLSGLGRDVVIPGGAAVFARYSAFQRALPSVCKKLHWTLRDLPFLDFSTAVAAWCRANPMDSSEHERGGG
jgi:hypothetical protein